MLDLHTEFGLFADEVRAAIEAVLQTQQFIGGPAITRLEEEIAQRLSVEHAVAVSSGTDALLCALMALGIEPGDEVVVPSFTFFATAGSVARLGATPVFADVDERTFNLDASSVEAALTRRTRAIIPVHLYGQCADLDAIRAIADRIGAAVVEDAAQAIGATYRERFAGSLGDVACLSFYPTKNLGGFGEGGMILTRNEELAGLARQLRNHGESRRYVHQRIGGNFRLDTLKAAILLVKLGYLDEFTRRRQENAALYDRFLADAPVTTPWVAPYNRHVYHQYTIQCERRDELAAFLEQRGIATGIYYPVPLHRQECFASLRLGQEALPACERLCGRVLSLPCHPMLAFAEIEFVAGAVRDFYDAH